MKWLLRIGIVLGLAAVILACQQDPQLSPEEAAQVLPTLSVSIDFPKTGQTKAELGADSAEKKINNLVIWVFLNQGHTLVWDAPMVVTGEDLPGAEGGIKTYSQKVSWSFMANRPAVDVFVVANVNSIGYTTDGLAAITDYDMVKDLAFGKTDNADFYGITLPVRSVDPDVGLPMSGMRVGMSVIGSGQLMKLETVQLKRAVSRLRMVFCKTASEGEGGNTDNQTVQITGITFYGGMLPLQEYVFTEDATGVKRSDPPVAADYEANTFSVGNTDLAKLTNDNLKAHPYPESLVYINQDPEQYQELMDAAANANPPTVSDLGYFYFRETDQLLRGRINYKINGNDRPPKEFAMVTRGDFARNHTWTLFAYFMSGRNLQISLAAQPWDKTDYHIDFSDQTVTVTDKFIVDEQTVEVLSTNGAYRELKLLTAPARAHLTITTPIGGTLYIKPEGAASLFVVSPERINIDPDRDNGVIPITIARATTDIDISELPESETTLTLSFTVEMNHREVDANSEVIDTRYRFHL